MSLVLGAIVGWGEVKVVILVVLEVPELLKKIAIIIVVAEVLVIIIINLE
jgi:hypothetical protein